jgi:hypothetical protein
VGGGEILHRRLPVRFSTPQIYGLDPQTRRPSRLIAIGIGIAPGLFLVIARTSARFAPGSALASTVIEPPSPPAPFTFHPAAP